MAQVVAVILQKGGTAKTVTTANVGVALAELGQRVLLIDYDPQANLTDSFGINPGTLRESMYDVMHNRKRLEDIVQQVHGIDLAPSTIDLSAIESELVNEVGPDQILTEHLSEVATRYDWILIDCPPSLGFLTKNALTAADSYLVPCETQYLALRGLDHLQRTIQRVQRRTNPRLKLLGVLPTKFNSRATHDREVLEQLETRFPGQVFEPVRIAVRFSDATAAGEPLVLFDPSHAGSRSYRALAEQLIQVAVR